MPLNELNGKIVINPEDFSIINRTISGVDYTWTSGTYGGKTALRVLPDNGSTFTSTISTTNPELAVELNIRNTGAYYVWVLGYYTTNLKNSVYYGINSAASAFGYVNIIGTPVGEWAWTNTLGSLKRFVNLTTPGKHTFHIWMRDAGFAVAKVILTLNPNFTPIPDSTLWRKQQIYQIITDRFDNGNSLNDTSTGGFSPAIGDRCHGGDFRGIQKRLPYIKNLGATAIWFSPFLRNGLSDYHGYAATRFLDVEPRMGTLEELQILIAAAHRLGLFVIADVVANHGSNLIDSAQSGWPTYRTPPNGYSLRYNSLLRYPYPFDNEGMDVRIGRMFHNNGEISNWQNDQQVNFGDLLVLDDFRTEAPYIREKMSEVWTFWMEALDLDGFRVDTVKHVEMDFWDVWCKNIHDWAIANDNPNFFIFGETYDGNDQKVGQYTGTKKTGVYKFDGMADFPLYFMMNDLFCNIISSLNRINERYTNLSNSTLYDQNTIETMVTFIDNHDVPRFLNQGGSPAHLRLALVFLYTSKGIPSLYYGTEQEFDGGADPANRADMFDGPYKPGTKTGENFDMTGETYRLINSLGSARQLYTSLSLGTFTSLYVDTAGPGLFAYARRFGNEEVIVVLNNSNITRVLPQVATTKPAGTIFYEILVPGNTATVSSGANGFPSLPVEPLGYRIFMSGSSERWPIRTQVTNVTPAYRAEGVSTGTAISVTFNTQMQTSGAEIAFSITPEVAGTFAWSNGDTVLTFTPNAPLEENETYTVKIADTAIGISTVGGVSNSSVNRLLGEFQTNFATGASRYGTRPIISEPPLLVELTSNSATVMVDVAPNELSTVVTIEYGTTTSYGAETAPTVPPTGRTGYIGNSRFSASLKIPITISLTPNTLYNYRIKAVNARGTSYSRNYTFTTKAV